VFEDEQEGCRRFFGLGSHFAVAKAIKGFTQLRSCTVLSEHPSEGPTQDWEEEFPGTQQLKTLLY
jgi:hypothetical protein